MAYITGPDVVKYACTCGLLKTIPQLYFCRYCQQLRCGFCVCHEADSHFCGKCLENLPSSEVRLKKNRCGNCYVCPSCQQDLSTRIGSKAPSNPEDPKSTPKKMYYLCCLYCRWSSRDVGIPDQSSATGGWPDRENIHANRLQELIDSYKAIVLAEKQQKDKEKKKQRAKFITYTDLTGITAASLRKSLGLPEEYHHSINKNKPKEPEPAKARTEVDDLPEELLTKPINLLEVTTIEQRLLQPDSQPNTVDKLFPMHKQLSVKRSLRCRNCEHNVSKPEFNPNSVKFKIQLFAFYHIPEIRLVTIGALKVGQPSELIIKFTNPTQHQTTITLLPLNFVEEEEDLDNNLSPSVLEIPSAPSSLSSQPSSLLSLSSRQPSITIKPRNTKQEINGLLEIPNSQFILPPRDDAAEYDDSGEISNIQDDSNLVVWRKSNKAFIKLTVTPQDGLKAGDEVTTAFTMQHIYTNTLASSSLENKGPNKYTHRVKVFIILGNIAGSE